MSLGRIERCFTDNIYLIESLPEDEETPFERSYVIMGNSGKTYIVTIAHKPRCTCPDFKSRSSRCKHIFFVLIRIMNIENFKDRTYSEEELLQMFKNIPEVAKNLIYQGELPAQQEEVNQKFDKDDVCPICLDPLENGKELDYCKYSCGKTIHKKCFTMWEKSKGGICVFCRGQWYSDFPKIKPKKVSMHPIIENKVNEENKNSNNNENNHSAKPVTGLFRRTLFHERYRLIGIEQSQRTVRYIQKSRIAGKYRQIKPVEQRKSAYTEKVRIGINVGRYVFPVCAGHCRIRKRKRVPDDKILIYKRSVLRYVPQSKQLPGSPEHFRVYALAVGGKYLRYPVPYLVYAESAVIVGSYAVRHHIDIAVHFSPLKRGNHLAVKTEVLYRVFRTGMAHKERRC